MNFMIFFRRHLVLGLFLIFLVGCDNIEHGRLHREIPMEQERGVPLSQNIDETTALARKYAKLKNLKEMFEVEECIKLEAYDIAPMSIITHLVRVGDHLFFNDLPLHQVFQYDMHGNFHGAVGRVGAGPGEYEAPSSIVANKNNLIIFDGGRAKYLIYDSKGNYLKMYDGTKHYINSSTLIPWNNKLFVIGFSGYSPTAPYHAILGMEEKDFRLVTGFGERPDPAILPYKRTPNTLHHKQVPSYAMVGEHIWVGSPFQSTIEVFDLRGRFVASLPSGVNGVKLSDFGDSPTPDTFNQLQQTKFLNGGLRVVSPWVIAYFTRGSREIVATVYDFEGNILVANILAPSIFTNTIAQSVDDRLVCPIVLESFTLYMLTEQLGERGARKVMDSGFEPGSKEEAMYLVISRPKIEI